MPLFHLAGSAPFMAQDGSCFYVSTESVGWETAKTGCEDIGGHLVIIKCAVQQQKVVNFLSGSSTSLYILTLFYLSNFPSRI